MKNHFGEVLVLGLVLGLAVLPLKLSAATVAWIGGSGDWDTATNWSTDALPVKSQKRPTLVVGQKPNGKSQKRPQKLTKDYAAAF